MKPEMKLKIKMKETVVFVAPTGQVVATRTGRELQAAEVVTGDGKIWYLAFGETNFPRLIPRWAAEVTAGIPQFGETLPGQPGALTN